MFKYHDIANVYLYKNLIKLLTLKWYFSNAKSEECFSSNDGTSVTPGIEDNREKASFPKVRSVSSTILNVENSDNLTWLYYLTDIFYEKYR